MEFTVQGLDLRRIHYDGPEYRPKRDADELRSQSAIIFNLCRDARWRTVAEISEVTGFPENSISAQLRHFRKPRFGSHTVNRRQREGCKRLYEYQLIPKVLEPQQEELAL